MAKTNPKEDVQLLYNVLKSKCSRLTNENAKLQKIIADYQASQAINDCTQTEREQLKETIKTLSVENKSLCDALNTAECKIASRDEAMNEQAKELRQMCQHPRERAANAVKNAIAPLNREDQNYVTAEIINYVGAIRQYESEQANTLADKRAKQYDDFLGIGKAFKQ